MTYWLTMTVADKWEDGTIRSLTPQLIPVFKYVIENADDQLTAETKDVVMQVAQYLKGMNSNWDLGV